MSFSSFFVRATFLRTSIRIFDTKDWSISDMVTLTNNTIVASIEAILLDTKYKTHNSYNAYVISFKEDGSQNWSRTIQKKQITTRGLSGHVLVPAKDNVLVIYNDNIENINKKPDDPSVEGFKTKDGMAVVQEIDPTGKVTKYALTKDKDLAGCSLFLNSLAKIEEDHYFCPCMNMKSAFSIESRNLTFKVK